MLPILYAGVQEFLEARAVVARQFQYLGPVRRFQRRYFAHDRDRAALTDHYLDVVTQVSKHGIQCRFVPRLTARCIASRPTSAARR